MSTLGGEGYLKWVLIAPVNGKLNRRTKIGGTNGPKMLSWNKTTTEKIIILRVYH